MSTLTLNHGFRATASEDSSGVCDTYRKSDDDPLGSPVGTEITLVPAAPHAGEEAISVGRFPCLIGRSNAADVHVEDRWTSRWHCEIDVADGGLVVRDLASRHGTYLNGEPIIEKHLRDGDLISIGISEFRVRFDAGESC